MFNATPRDPIRLPWRHRYRQDSSNDAGLTGLRAMDRFALPGIAALVSLICPAGVAMAQNATGTLQVTLKVANDCQLQSNGGGNNAVLDFGLQKAGPILKEIDGSTAAGGDIKVDCTGDAANPKISFSAGTNAVGDQRQMRFDTGGSHGISLIPYDIYIDSGRNTALIPDKSYDLVPDPLSNGFLRGTNTIQVFGRIKPGPTLEETNGGAYSDTLSFQIEL